MGAIGLDADFQELGGSAWTKRWRRGYGGVTLLLQVRVLRPFKKKKHPVNGRLEAPGPSILLKDTMPWNTWSVDVGCALCLFVSYIVCILGLVGI